MPLCRTRPPSIALFRHSQDVRPSSGRAVRPCHQGDRASAYARIEDIRYVSTTAASSRDLRARGTIAAAFSAISRSPSFAARTHHAAAAVRAGIHRSTIRY